MQRDNFIAALIGCKGDDCCAQMTVSLQTVSLAAMLPRRHGNEQ
jgi:hypothetical protein